MTTYDKLSGHFPELDAVLRSRYCRQKLRLDLTRALRTFRRFQQLAQGPRQRPRRRHKETPK